MKKIIAMLTFTAVLCSFASCGQDSADEVSDESSVISVSETEENSEEEKEEETDDSETDEVDGEEISETENETEDTGESSEKTSADGSYVEAIETLLECMNNNDVEGMISLVFPERYRSVIELMADMEGISLDEMVGDMDDISQESVRFVEIVSDEPMTDDYMEMLNEMYGGFQAISDYIEQNGKDNIDYDKLEEAIYSIDDVSDIKPYFEITDGHIVNCMFETEDENGEKDTYEQELIMYYIDGEGWKTDLSMMGYVKKSKQSSINATASTIIKATNVACTELDEMGVELPEKCIISSDHSKNYNVSDDFVSQVEETLETYFPDYENYDYFVIIKDGCAVYLASVNPDSPKFVGTYPANQLYSADEEYISKDEKLTYDELYDICLEQIK
ncbi:MAG: hypothetical protein K2I06_09625 [Ruminococcus sp.]|nr:hypothetical protein [Ruminococcus sp.]